MKSQKDLFNIEGYGEFFSGITPIGESVRTDNSGNSRKASVTGEFQSQVSVT
jgi:hypothetical protein